ncbi:MAG: hypothetical protein NC078_04790 [Ruminococcus sp.]|nr:hypothetical protein [Ruminococcus sp.]
MSIPKIKRMPKILLALLTAFSLTGCLSSADSLLTAPMLSEEQAEIYGALKESAGEDISLVYPKGGAYRSSVVFADLDGDGLEEAAAFYGKKDSSEGNVRVNILDREQTEDGGYRWRSVYDHAGAGSSVEEVFFINLGGSGRVRMAVGYGLITPTEKALRVYNYEDGMLTMEYAESYYKMLRLDLDRDGGEDIAVVNCNNENHSAYLSLVTDKGAGAVSSTRVALSESTADLPNVLGGYIGTDTPAIFIDGLLGSGSLATEIVYCIEGQLRNPAVLDGSDITRLTTRSRSIYCRDADGDGIIEIPSREPFPGYRDTAEALYITNWNVFENYTVVKKFSSLTDLSSGYVFMIPGRWEGQVTVKNDSVTGERVFYKYNTSLTESRLELMRITACTPDSEEEMTARGYFKAAGSETAVYMVKLGDTDDNLLLTTSEVINNMLPGDRG